MLSQIREEQHERKRAEALSKDIQWMYSDGSDLVQYESALNAKIELAYHDKKTAVTITSEGEDFEINFKTMQEKDTYGNTTEVQRIDLRKGNKSYSLCKLLGIALVKAAVRGTLI